MANKSPVPFELLTFTLAPQEEIPIPGTFLWLEILTEFTEGSPSDFRDVLAVRFYPDQNSSPLPPGITVILEPDFPSSGARVQNTHNADSITFSIAFGATRIPARDNRLTVTGGTNIPVTVVSPLPLPITAPSPIHVIADNGTGNPVSVLDTPIENFTGFDVTGNVDILSAVANVNGAFINDVNMSVTGPGDYLLQVDGDTIFGVTGSAAGAALNSQLQHRYFVPAGKAISVVSAGSATANRAIGSYQLR